MASGSEALDDLLARQARLREWIARLDDPQDDVPAHVADRVRGDYESRLADVEAELRGHVDSLRGEVDRLHEMLHLARESHQDATDKLAEARLRHRLGEIDDAAWGGRRAELERAAEEAAVREREAEEELGRLEELLARLEEPGVEEPAAEPWAERAEAPPAAGAAVRAEPAPAPGWTSPAETATEEPRPVENDLPGDLDRTLAEEPEPDTRPTSGVKCPECGYTNDANAWYCGVCGVDLT